MKYTKISVNSARKNAGMNKKSDAFNYIKQKYGNRDNLYITFTDISKVGIRPLPLAKDTPVGVYTFPLSYLFTEEFQTLISLDIANRPILNVLSIKESPSNILEIPSSINLENKLKDLQQFIDNKKWKLEDDIEYLIQDVKNTLSNKSDSAILYKLATIIPDKVEKVENSRSYLYRKAPIIMNIILRKALGYEVIQDNGTSTIHHREPTQTLFLSSSSFKLIESIPFYRDRIRFNFIEELIHAISSKDYLKNSNNWYDYNLALDYLRFREGLKPYNKKFEFSIKDDDTFYERIKSLIGLYSSNDPRSLSKEERRFRICFSSYFRSKDLDTKNSIIMNALPDMKNLTVKSLASSIRSLCGDFPVDITSITDEDIVKVNDSLEKRRLYGIW